MFDKHKTLRNLFTTIIYDCNHHRIKYRVIQSKGLYEVLSNVTKNYYQ